MGYEPTLILVGVVVDPDRGKAMQLLLKKRSNAKNPGLRLLFRQLALTPDSTIEFRLRPKDDVPTDEVPDEAGCVPSNWGRWSEAEALAERSCCHAAEGEIIERSREGDGEAWAWEFYNGRIRYLQLQPVRPCRRVSPPQTQALLAPTHEPNLVPHRCPQGPTSLNHREDP